MLEGAFAVSELDRGDLARKPLQNMKVAGTLPFPEGDHIYLIVCKVIERHAIEPRELRSLVERRRPLPELPVAHRLARHADGARHLLLAHARALAQRKQLVGYHRRPPLFGSRKGCLASSHSPEEGAHMPANPFAILSNALATSLYLAPTCRYARARARAIAAPATAMAAANSSTSPVCAATEATSAPVASVAA